MTQPLRVLSFCVLLGTALAGQAAFAQSAPLVPAPGAATSGVNVTEVQSNGNAVEADKGATPNAGESRDTQVLRLEAGATYPLVVELYTSQGCASCPPADALVTALAKRPDLLPLSLHIDYWDYLGWADPFAQATNAKRQQGYARATGQRMVYTPQFVINGQSVLAAADALSVEAALAEAGAPASEVTLEARVEAARMEVKLSAPAPLGGSADLSLVRFLPEARVTVKGGENAGLKLRYTNVVTDWLRLARWDGATPLTLQAALTGPERAALVVQDRRGGRVLGALLLP